VIPTYHRPLFYYRHDGCGLVQFRRKHGLVKDIVGAFNPGQPITFCCTLQQSSSVSFTRHWFSTVETAADNLKKSSAFIREFDRAIGLYYIDKILVRV
jgi:hypothetical protein